MDDNKITIEGESLHQLVGDSIIVFLMVLVVSMRYASRMLTKAELLWDDGLTLLAMAQGIASLAIQGEVSTLGLGDYLGESSDSDENGKNYYMLLKYTMVLDVIYIICMCTTKLSVLLFYLRIFPSARMRRSITGVSIVVYLWSLGNLITLLLACTPPAALWNPSVDGTCGARDQNYMPIGTFNIITSIVIVALPVPSLWKLQMKKSKRVGLVCCFLVGLTTTIIAIIRMIHLGQTPIFTSYNEHNAVLVHWTTVELNLAIVCASLPMIWGLYLRFFPESQFLGPFLRLGSRGSLLHHRNWLSSLDMTEKGNGSPGTSGKPRPPPPVLVTLLPTKSPEHTEPFTPWW